MSSSGDKNNNNGTSRQKNGAVTDMNSHRSTRGRRCKLGSVNAQISSRLFSHPLKEIKWQHHQRLAATTTKNLLENNMPFMASHFPFFLSIFYLSKFEIMNPNISKLKSIRQEHYRKDIFITYSRYILNHKLNIFIFN